MRGREGGETNDEAGIRVVELQLGFKTIQVCLVENMKGIEMTTKCLNTHHIYNKADTLVVHK